jgi:hypothetical protein
MSLWGVLNDPALGRLLRLPQVRKEPAQHLRRERQRVPSPFVALCQGVAEPAVPPELRPSHQLVNRDVQGDMEDADRLADKAARCL